MSFVILRLTQSLSYPLPSTKTRVVHREAICVPTFNFLYRAHANYTIISSLGTLRADKEQYCTYKHIRPYANDALQSEHECWESRAQNQEENRFALCVYVLLLSLAFSLIATC